MHVTYEGLLDELKKKFKSCRVTSTDRTFFVNEHNEVVASYDDHSINMYFTFPENDHLIWNHYGLVVAAFAKDFKIDNNEYVDCIMIDGLCGACNYIDVFANFGAATDVMGWSITDELFAKLQPRGGSGILKSSNEVYNECGTLYYDLDNDYAIIRVGDITIENLKVSKFDTMVPNVVNEHNTATVDYTKIFIDWRSKNRDYFVSKYGSAAADPNLFFKRAYPDINYSTIVRNKQKTVNTAYDYKDDTYNDLVSKKFK